MTWVDASSNSTFHTIGPREDVADVVVASPSDVFFDKIFLSALSSILTKASF